jgi:hypothetical protein
VNAETRASLAEIRAASDALLSNQREQFSEVLHAALKTAVPEAVMDISVQDGYNDGDGTPILENLEDRLMVRIWDALEDAPRIGASPATNYRLTAGHLNGDIRRQRRSDPIYARLSRYPDEKRGLEILPILNNLNPQEATAFGRIATQISEKARHGEGSRLAITTSGRPRESLRRLVELNLIRMTESSIGDSRSSSKHWIELTDLGVDVASLVLGQGSVPVWLPYG